MPKSYSPEFRRRAVALCRVGDAPSKIARDLGVSEATVYRLIAPDEVDRGERAQGHVAGNMSSSQGPARGSGSSKRSWS